MRGPANAAEENDPLVQGQLRSDLTPGDRAEEASIKERAKSSTPRNSETNALHKARGTFIAAFVTTVCCTALIVGVLFRPLLVAHPTPVWPPRRSLEINRLTDQAKQAIKDAAGSGVQIRF